jgi:glutamine amidotransferase
MIGIINYGLGNILSVSNVIQKAGGQAEIISTPKDLEKFDKIILPGVGHFGEGVRALREQGFWNSILSYIHNEEGTILGICLGMQILCTYSEEGDMDGLGVIDANVQKFKFNDECKLKVPHMGWNKIDITRPNFLFPTNEEINKFYFVHSYKVVPKDNKITIATCNYGEEFCAAYQMNHVYGVQFHPEKSHKFGIEMINRFIKI